MAKNKEVKKPATQEDEVYIGVTAVAALVEEKSLKTTGKDVSGKEIPVSMSTKLKEGMIIPVEDTFVNETDNSRV